MEQNGEPAGAQNRNFMQTMVMHEWGSGEDSGGGERGGRSGSWLVDRKLNDGVAEKD